MRLAPVALVCVTAVACGDDSGPTDATPRADAAGSVDGAPGVVDGAVGIVDGAPGTVDGPVGIVDGSVVVIDGGGSAIDAAAVFDGMPALDAMTVPDATLPVDADLTPDADPFDQSGVTSPTQVVIWAVDFDQDAVWLKNISNNTVDMGLGDFCIPFVYLPSGTANFGSVLGSFSFAPGEVKKVCLDDDNVPNDCDGALNGTNAAWDIDEDEELIVYEIDDGHSPSNMQDYIRWGDTAGTGRQVDADTVGMWTIGEFVPITPGHRGLIAVGDLTTAAGYMSVTSPADCCGL